MNERRPLARLERREVQRTFRFTESEDKALQEGAVADHEAFTEYVRNCAMEGHTMREARRYMKRADAGQR